MTTPTATTGRRNRTITNRTIPTTNLNPILFKTTLNTHRKLIRIVIQTRPIETHIIEYGDL
ncbi:hypothetical protein Hanom_Chr08g00688001 [Helianthus anomalus]